jgi:hypothetical protein
MISVNTFSIFRGRTSISKQLPIPETVEVSVYLDKDTKEIVGIGAEGPQNIQIHVFEEEGE